MLVVQVRGYEKSRVGGLVMMVKIVGMSGRGFLRLKFT
jgi:hypothetical protein